MYSKDNNFYFSYKKWKKYKCMYDCINEYGHDICYLTKDYLADRIMFIINKNKKPKDNPLIYCRIEQNIDFIEDDKSFHENGDQIKWYDIEGENMVVTKVREFDFIYSTNDLDIDIFLPHINILLQIYGINEMELMKDIIFFVKTKGKNSMHNKKKKRINNNEIKEYLNNQFDKIEKIVYEKIIVIATNKWKHLIEDTLVNVFISYFKLKLDLREMKECPHIKKRQKKARN